MTSTPVYTSTADGYRDAKEIAGLRPVAPAKPRVPRKKAAPLSVSTGIVCFCGERFAESQALEFMKHLRAEVGEVLDWRKRHTERIRRYNTKPGTRQYQNRWRREKYRSDPEYAAREREKARERHEPHREDPEWRAKKAAKERARRARKKAEREAHATPGEVN